MVHEVGSFVFGLASAGQINGLLAHVTVGLNHAGTLNRAFSGVLT